jgi:hypothetical protein
LYKKLPETVKMSEALFKVSVIFPGVYILAICVFMLKVFGTVMAGRAEPPVWIFGIMVPLHLFTMLCIFYSFYFIAKCLKAVELQRNVAFSDFVAEFFLLWFYFVGVWIIQPRINKLFGENSNSIVLG